MGILGNGSLRKNQMKNKFKIIVASMGEKIKLKDGEMIVMKSVFILWQRNGFVEADWRMLSVYAFSDSAQRALEDLKKLYPEGRGYEYKTTEVRTKS